MKRFQLKYTSPQMEEEYVLLKQQTNIENIHMSFYFIIFLLMIPGIPAIIEAHYTDAIIAVATAILLSFIYFWKGFARKWVQFLAGLIISSFDFCMLLMPTSSFDTSSKGLLFFRGYAFAGINVVLLSRFATQKQKLLFLVFCYAFRFTLIILLDPLSAQVYTIIRHIYIDLFALYVNFSHEKKERVVFKRFYEYREELTKFKELLADYLPQAITITKSFKEKPLFSNKSFQDLFGRSSVDMGLLSDSEAQTTLQTRNLLSPTCKFDIKYLQVNKNTLREAGIVPVQIKNTTDELVYLKDIGEDLIKGNLLDNKPLSLSAVQSTESENKSFDVVLKKVKWDGEDAVAVIFNDITYQENLIRLKISTMNKDKIIATLSHELRTPLNGIIGILEMVEKRGKDSEILEYIGLCKDNAYLLLSLVNSLLDLQQFRQGKLTLNPDRIKIMRILRDVTRLFRFQCQRKNINLNFKINEGIPSYIITDEHRLKQILINLIANAIKFTSKGNVSIEVWQEIGTADSIQISVKDTGIGIREEDKSKLFTMSERIENGAIVNAHGVGLGLTVSNVLACILGGKSKDKAIEVCSKYNEGSQFTFSILKDLNKGPIEKEGLNVLNELETSLEKLDANEEYRIPLEYSQEDMDIKPSPASKVKKYVSSHLIGFPSGFLLGLRKGTSKLQFSPDGFSPLEQKENSPETNKILKNVFSLDNDSSRPVTPRVTESEKGCLLVVDDNPFNLLVAENIIKDLGYTVQLAKSGAEAIEIVKAKNCKLETFKAILMDCQMPIMDGFETTRKLRELMERNEASNIPIIALTANNGQEDIKRCYESGMVNHLSKPLFANALLKALSGVNQRFTGPHFDSTTKI